MISGHQTGARASAYRATDFVNILLLTPTPPDDLHRIRALQIMKAMAREHRVTLLTFVRNRRDREKCAAVRDYCDALHMVPFSLPRAMLNCLLALPTSIPLRVAYSRHPAMHRKLREILREGNHDLVYVKRKRMGQYARKLRSVPRILDLTDAVALYYRRSLETVSWWRYPVHLEEYLKIRPYEPALARDFDLTVVCSRVDADYIDRQAGEALPNLRVIPNVVDTDFYYACEPAAETRQPLLLFSGLMDKHVNVDAARYLVQEIFPRIRERCPEASLHIVGPRPASEVRAMAQIPGVTVTGYVDDLRDYIARATLVMCPVRVGAGTRNKILQAMSMRRAVVSTPLGAEGLEYQAGRDLLIAEDAASFARATLELIENPARRESLADHGRELVQRSYSLDFQAARLTELYSELGLAR
jgi:sugar transferase (PEP-CTERM/EpsH1 system associated)